MKMIKSTFFVFLFLNYPWVAAKENEKVDTVSLGCPYEAKSEEAGELVSGVKDNITKLIENLKSEGKDCTLSSYQSDFSSIQTALANLNDNKYPEQKNMGNTLKVGDSSFICSATHAPLYSFISTYIRDRITQVASSDEIDAGISGDLGNIIEDTISECVDDVNNKVIIAKDVYVDCIYKKLKFNPNNPSNPASPIDTFYRKECIGDSSKIFDDEFTKQAQSLEEKRQLFEKSMNTIVTSSQNITTALMGNSDKKCAEIKSRMQSLIQQGINLAGNLAGPWGMLAGTSLSPLVNMSFGMIGTNQMEVKKLQKIQDEFMDENFRDHFSCNIFQANKLKCELLNRDSLLQDSVGDCSPSNDEKGIREIISLGKALKEKESELAADKLTPTQAEELYKNIFMKKVSLAGEERTPYSILFDTEKGMIESTLKYQQDLSRRQGKQTPREKIMVTEMKQLKDELDKFEKEYKGEVGDYVSGAKAAKILMSGSYNHAVLNYLNILTGDALPTKVLSPDIVKQYPMMDLLWGKKEAKMSSADPLSRPDLINKALAKELSEQMVNQTMDTLSSLIPNDFNVTANLSETLDNFYKNFLIEDHIRKGYILEPTLKNLKDTAKLLNQNASYDSKGNLNYVSTQFSTRLFPMFRDCLMNYQAGLEPQKDGKYTMNKDFKESCGFLRGCSGEKNTLGLPFDINAEAQANPYATNIEEFKVCSIANNFDVLSNKFKEEVIGKNSICGLPIKEAVGDLPIK